MLKNDHAACVLCGQCVEVCPFGALEFSADKSRIDALDGCRACGACVEVCPVHALTLDAANSSASALSPSECSGFLVYLQAQGSLLLPVSFEMIGTALRLRDFSANGQKVFAVLAGSGVTSLSEALSGYGLDGVFVYDDPCFENFKADAYAAAVADCVRLCKPAVLLIGATNEGRTIAPLVAVAFQTGLTADCTELFINEDGLLAQVRPAFGGNVMARIVTRNTRPQMVTVRSGVMPAAVREGTTPPEVHLCKIPEAALSSRITVVERQTSAAEKGLSEARIILAVGNGVAKKEDLDFFKDCAKKLGAVLASSRALVEKGWMPLCAQIGLSGTAVAPELLITCGISGSVQFRAGIGGAKNIIAVNTDENAPIFSVAHHYAVGDMYELLPKIIEKL
ncbi:MAG: FAD-binding protein [Christensenellales bacterium]|jgi:electron transfer flavoprotein alpha subunit